MCRRRPDSLCCLMTVMCRDYTHSSILARSLVFRLWFPPDTLRSLYRCLGKCLLRPGMLNVNLLSTCAMNCFPFSTQVLASRPQPSRAFATFVAIPEWVTYAGISGVVMDARASTLGQDGPVFAAYLSRPTTAQEIRREAGFYSIWTVCHPGWFQHGAAPR